MPTEKMPFFMSWRLRSLARKQNGSGMNNFYRATDFQKASENCPIRDLLPRIDEKQYDGYCQNDLVSQFAEGL
ncbi:hypothetical protein OPV22_018433 [Ensete ventricosum]|uniref:Uncharacterized protein n=1 Tax=Ensete ventricosum TaxID=4639 RepID=A0AAV8QYM8_ENSVE|nr:hypothetical protein OPV22_018433 [Ensete ventricosum]